MVVGPVDVIIIGFPGNKFTGKIAPAVADLVASGTVRILDLLFVSKSADGTVTSLRIEDLDASLVPGFLSIDIHHAGILDHADAEELEEDLTANSSALMVAYENVWAGRFVAAINEADAVVIDQIRIPAHVVNAARSASASSTK